MLATCTASRPPVWRNYPPGRHKIERQFGATRTQQFADFVMSSIRALEYFGVVPEILVPDQL